MYHLILIITMSESSLANNSVILSFSKNV